MNLKELVQQKSDRAVSPVIGVILMVAITVILAAVIGAFVLGLGDDLGSNPQAAVTVDGSTVVVQSLDADGVAVVQDDGSVTATLTSVGSSVEVATTDSRVIAYNGAAPATDGTENIDGADRELSVIRTLD